MNNLKKSLSLTLGAVLAGAVSAAHADVPVKVFNQNIEAHVVCANASKQNMFINFINNQKPDFILTQEYEPNGGLCINFFNTIKAQGYQIVKNKNQDTTLFYRTEKWHPLEEVQLAMVPNKPDQWGHDGLRQAMFGVFQSNVDSDVTLEVANAHLCIGYSSSYCMYSNGQPRDEKNSHEDDFGQFLGHLASSPNWVMAGDLNIPAGQKPSFTSIIQQYGATNITELNNVNFDMAFHKGEKIIGMKYTSTQAQLPIGVFSDHAGFTLDFTMKK